MTSTLFSLRGSERRERIPTGGVECEAHSFIIAATTEKGEQYETHTLPNAIPMILWDGGIPLDQ